MMVPFTSQVRVAEDVLLSKVQGECVLLHLGNETYYGLDEVGTRMWEVLTTADSIQAAFEVLAQEYDVEPQQLRQDLSELLDKLTAQGLLKVQA